MSDTGIKSTGRFIPTLTEVIEEADLLNQSQTEDGPKVEPSGRTGVAPESAATVAQEKVGDAIEKPSAPESKREPVTTGRIFVGNSFSTRTQEKKADKGSADFEPVLAKDEELLNASSNVFSALSRNPVATSGSPRPSDLMLVALTERIAAKVRIRIEKEVEQHIQNTIFPLLDNFAVQLVEHIQEDLVKVMRESIAQVTREELEWLRQRDNQKPPR